MPKQDHQLEAIGKVIKNLRKTNGLTINALATKSAINETRLASFENGQEESTLLELANVAKALGTTTENLLKQAGL